MVLWNEKKRKGGLKEEKIDAQERSTVLRRIGSVLDIHMSNTWSFDIGYGNGETVIPVIQQMANVRCQERAREERGEKKGERGSFHDWPVGSNFN